MRLSAIIRLAWWDSHGSRRKLLFFVAAVCFGVSAFVGIGSFTEDVRLAMNEQAKTLLGSDIALSRRQPYDEESEQAVRDIPGERRREITFTSMAMFPSGESRLAYVSAIEPGFPFYGTVETTPAGVYSEIFSEPKILVDQLLMAQYALQVGSIIKIGELEFQVAGSLERIPGETVFREVVAPRLYLSAEFLPQTKLIQRGSRMNYRYHYRVSNQALLDERLPKLEEKLSPLGISIETVAERRKNFGQTLENTYRLLSLVWCLALVLAGLGIASSASLYIAGKRNGIAILRCLGFTLSQIAAVFLLQITIAATLAGVFGALLGFGLQQLLPQIFREALPVEVSLVWHWRYLAGGVLLAFGLGLLFSLEPTLRLREVPALAVFRQEEHVPRKLQGRVFLWLLVFVVAALTSVLPLGGVSNALILWAVFAASLALLFLAAKCLQALLRRLFQNTASFTLRTGLAYLYRPRNQTGLLFVAIGVLALLVTVLSQLHSGLSGELAEIFRAGSANTLLFDIQPNDRERVEKFLSAKQLPVVASAPIVTMRLERVNDRQTGELRREGGEKIPLWTLRREYRSTYRSELSSGEQILSGEWVASWDAVDEPVPVSLESGIAEKLGVRLGDRLDFNVQGLAIRTYVKSLRKVDWKRVQPNFFVVFPNGVLEGAPQTFVVTTRTATPDEAAHFQRALLQTFPGVSVIDATLILRTVQEVSRRMLEITKALMVIVVLAVAAILLSVTFNSKEVRRDEKLLLQVLGATSWQTRRISLAEFASLGFIAAFSGTALGLAAYMLISRFIFELRVAPVFGTAIFVVAGVSAITAIVGVFSNHVDRSASPLRLLG